LNCPNCNQRLQIPQPTTPAAPPINKTILAAEESGPSPAIYAPPQPSYPSQPPIPVLQEMAAAPPAIPTAAVRRETCLECGADLTGRDRLHTCGDCGAALCSAICQREHRYHAHSPKKRRRPEICDRCGSTARPYESTVISQAGWITFALLLVFFFPLFWIGLLMTESRIKCSDCGAFLD
jgi:hypothetical protein